MEGPTSSWGSRNRLTLLNFHEHDDYGDDDDDDDDDELWKYCNEKPSEGLIY